jgi:endonuclease YncB( thermonuclease family)
MVAALVAACSPASLAQPISGIAKALDGDSLEVGGRQVRLFGVDAPEYEQTCQRNGQLWNCGAKAAEHLSKLVMGAPVTCVPVNVDEYERAVSRCTKRGSDLNKDMVLSGYAIAYRRYSNDYVAAEEWARGAKRGLWSGTFTNPSEWRDAERQRERVAQRRPAQRRAQAPAQPPAHRGGCTIKGNQGGNGWIYHLPGMPYYQKTRAEQMFCSEAEAQAAGYRRAKVR